MNLTILILCSLVLLAEDSWTIAYLCEEKCGDENKEMTYTKIPAEISSIITKNLGIMDFGLDDFWRYRERAKRIWTK